MSEIKIPLVKDIMSTRVVAVKADMQMDEAMRVLLRAKHSGAPVVDGEGKLVGMLSEKDCLRNFFGGMYNRLPMGYVRQFMAKGVTVCSPVDTMFRAVEIFFSHSFRRLPVMDGDKLVGIVSRRDVLVGSKEMWDEEVRDDSRGDWTDASYLTQEIQAALGKVNSASTDEVRPDRFS